MRIVHLGLGGFHRAHQAVYTADANLLGSSSSIGPTQDESYAITGVSFRNRRLVDALRRQDHRYAVVELGADAAPPREMRVIDETLLVSDEADAVVTRIGEVGTGAVTLTVTENAYPFDAAGTGLDVTDEGVRADLAAVRAGVAPSGVLGLLAAGMLARYRSHAAGLELVCCDNLTDNGPRLRALLTGFADELGGRAGAELGEYLRERVATPATMVDRIVPATNRRAIDLAAAAGIHDETAVPTEHFSMWVIEASGAGLGAGVGGGGDVGAGSAVGGALLADWARAGAILTDDVAAYELVKLRLLNAVNSTLAHLGLLAGHRYIHDALADPAIRRVAEGVSAEMAATVTPPPGLDLDLYREQVFTRFANAELAHTTRQVATTGAGKLSQRLPGALLWHEAHGAPAPENLATLTAAWLVGTAYPQVILEAGGLDELPGEVTRERVVQLATGCAPGRAAGGASTGREVARRVLTDAAVLGPVVAANDAFVDRVGEIVDEVTFRHQISHNGSRGR